MKNRSDPLPLMNAAQVEAYCLFLKRLAGRRQGTLPDRLRQYAADLMSLWSFT